VRQRLLALQKEYIIKLGDAVIATKSSDGQIQLHQIVNTTASGALAAHLVARRRISASMTSL
jgi:uncharacterized membrane protein